MCFRRIVVTKQLHDASAVYFKETAGDERAVCPLDPKIRAAL